VCTLTPWHTVDLEAQWRVYAEAYDPGRADELSHALYEQEIEAWQRAEQHHRSGTLDDLMRAAGVEVSGAGHESAMRAYLDAWTPHTHIDPEAPPLLQALREMGIRVGVLSNTLWPREHHEAVLARDGILDLLDGAVYSSEIPYTKPHPEAFHAAMKSVGVVDPVRVVFVGDRLFDDVSGAKGRGHAGRARATQRRARPRCRARRHDRAVGRPAPAYSNLGLIRPSCPRL